MTEARVVSDEEIKFILDTLLGMTWPIAATETQDMILRLGWEQLSRSIAKTNLSVSLTTASFTPMGGEIAQIDCYVSDTFGSNEVDGCAVARRVYPSMVETISACLGFEPTGHLWGQEGVKWDLTNGGRVNLPAGLGILLLQVWSPRLADLERFEIAHGVSPDSNLDDREV